MKLLSFGEIIWDVFGEECKLGGAPLNLAAHVAIQGEDAWLASAVGNDALGARALSEINALGLRTDYISVLDEKTTGQCTVTLTDNGTPSYKIVEDVAYDYITLPEANGIDFDVIAFGTLALRNRENLAALDNALKGGRFSHVYTDLNIRPPFYSRKSVEFCLSHATIAKISDEELPTVMRLLGDEYTDPFDAAVRISKRYPGIKLLIITQGAEGAFCYDCENERVYRRDAEKATVASTVGAGDSFGATFITNYVRTGDIPRAMDLAARVSAFVVSHQGAIPEGTREFFERITLS